MLAKSRNSNPLEADRAEPRALEMEQGSSFEIGHRDEQGLKHIQAWPQLQGLPKASSGPDHRMQESTLRSEPSRLGSKGR